jgi:hypothetical protein
MSFNIDFDQLFALRILFQDEYENESDIITELRYELLNMGLSEDEIPNILKEFYDNFGITISLDVIKQSIQNSLHANPLNNLFDLLNNAIQQSINLNNNNQENNQENN